METLVNPGQDRKIADTYKDIKGWGIDADTDNNPTYPMKKYDGSDHDRLNYERSPQQPITVELLKSNERPTVSRVFGTSTPPSGLSGMLRRFAFRFSEGSSGHWLTLILADRVNVVEGVIDDLKHGHVPNIIKEKGWNAEWKYNRKGAVKSIAIGAAVSAAIIAYLVYQNQAKKKRISTT